MSRSDEAHEKTIAYVLPHLWKSVSQILLAMGSLGWVSLVRQVGISVLPLNY
jgi:hypothetical protein